MSKLFVEIGHHSANCYPERLCGDSFMSRYLPEVGRTVMVLSDGMGHGAKANILSTLTASIFMGMAGSGNSVQEVAQRVMNTLPVCSRRGISYSTFTLINIDHHTRVVEIVEFDNPQAMIFRGSTPFECDWECITYEDQSAAGKMRTLLTTSFLAQCNDRIIIVSDGVTQSGLGTDIYPFGWGVKRFRQFLQSLINGVGTMDASELAWRVTNCAIDNDQSCPKDDITAAVVHFRQPRRLLLASCLPSLREQESALALKFDDYIGAKVICDYPLAEALASSWDRTITRNPTSTDPDVAPEWKIDSITRVTEGLVTISKALYILKVLVPSEADAAPRGRGAAYHICEEMLRADRIEIVIGMRNTEEGKSSPYDTAQEDRLLGLQRRTLENIAQLLEKKFSKIVRVRYL